MSSGLLRHEASHLISLLKPCFHYLMMDQSEALGRVIKAVGKAAELAAKLGIMPQALSQWDRVPHLRVLEVERITGVPRHELRPDIYPPSDSRRRK